MMEPSPQPTSDDCANKQDGLTLSIADSNVTSNSEWTLLPSALPASGLQRYILSEEIARGGMGVIYRAFDISLSREVAVKVLQDKFALDSSVAHRFGGEARITAQLQHPAIPPVHDIGNLADGRPFMALKLIKGQTLEHLLAARPDPSVERGRFVAAFEQLCQAVAYAHAHNVIHRDLKPANVMVGAFGEVQLMDWGLAKVLTSQEQMRSDAPSEATTDGSQRGSLRDTDGSFTQAGSVLGTPAYMSPEQAIGAVDKVDQRSDVFGLGAILAVILTGQPPFGPSSSETMRVQSAQGDVADCFARLDGCGAEPELVALCKYCLRSKRAERPADGGAVAQAVAQLRIAADERARRAELERVQAEGEKAAAAARALERRKRRRLGLSAAAALVLAAVVGLTAVLVVQHRANADLADKNRELANEQAKVQARFELAHKAIATFHTGVSEDVLLKNDQFKELRKRLLKEAAGFYGDLEKVLQGQTDAKSQRLLAEGYFQLGNLTRAIGSQPEALAVHRKALAVRRELALEADADVETRLDVTRSLQAMGNLLRATGDRKGALTAFQEQRDLATTLKAESSNDAVRATLAQSYHSIGLVLSQTAQRVDALASYEKAVALRQALADAHPDVAQFQSDLAASLINVGQLLSQTSNLTEALTAYEKALALRRKLADAFPDVPQFQNGLANCYNSIGVLLAQMGKSVEALATYRKALALQQSLADAHPAVIGYQADLARSLTNIATLVAQTGKPDEGLAIYQKALAVRQKLADAHPAHPEFRRDLARGHHAIGNLLRDMGKPAEALAPQQKALALRQELADASPDVLEYLSELAMSHNSVGVLWQETGKLGEAIVSLQKALQLQQKLVADHPTVVPFQSELARHHNNIGNLLREMGKPAEALPSFQKALALQQKLAADHPAVPLFQFEAAESYYNIGNLLAQTGQPAGGLTALEKAVALSRKLAESNPGVTEFQSKLARNLHAVGLVQAQEGKHEPALTAFEKARDIRQKLADAHPTISEYPRDLARSLSKIGVIQRRAGQPAAAASSFRQAVAILKRLPTPTAADHCSLACSFALLAGVAADADSEMTSAEGQAAADNAMASLRRAIAADYRDVANVRKDTDLDALRPRMDFQHLMTELEAKSAADRRDRPDHQPPKEKK